MAKRTIPIRVDNGGVYEKEVEFPPNSHASKEKSTEKKVEKVITGRVRTQKKGFGKKMTEAFLGDDVPSVGGYILHTVFIPAMKDLFADMVQGGIEMLLYGESKSSKIRSNKGKSFVNYSGISKQEERRSISTRNSARHSFDDIILDSKGEAEEVLDRLVDICEEYGVVTVADLFDLVGEPSSFTDNKYGWTNLRNASVNRVRKGYLLDLPKTEALD